MGVCFVIAFQARFTVYERFHFDTKKVHVMSAGVVKIIFMSEFWGDFAYRQINFLF